jgi:hypothetical protein
MATKKMGQVATPRIPQMTDASGGLFVYNGADDLSIDPCGCPWAACNGERRETREQVCFVSFGHSPPAFELWLTLWGDDV